MNYRIFSIGDNALTIEFGSEISLELNNLVLKLAASFVKASFRGFIEIIPSYASLTVFYNVVEIRKNYPEFATAFAAVKSFVESSLKSLKAFPARASRFVKIPVCFDPEYGLDLEFVALHNDISADEAIDIFLSKTYRIFMIGFLPGFSYMGEVDSKIIVPRKSAPRLRVPKGSVGIAGKQTGIYPLESPGGWQIIGRTPFELFIPEAEKPVVLQAGDDVKFYRIEKASFLLKSFKIEFEG